MLLSRLEANEKPENHQWINLAELATTLQKMANPLLDERFELNFDIPNDSFIYGAYNELYSAFSNLVLNAIKYSPEGGNIQVSWRNTEVSGIFTVKDEGIGIDPRYIPRLTERFFRVDKGRSSATGGTGLGLAIVKHVLIHHSAKLQVNSQPNYGSTFSCYFPADRVRKDPLLQAVTNTDLAPTNDSQRERT